MLKAVSSGGTAFTGSIAATQVALGSGANAFVGSPNFTYDSMNIILSVGSGNTTSAGVQMGYSGAMGFAVLGPTGITLSNTNASFLIQSGGTYIGVGTNSAGIIGFRPLGTASTVGEVTITNLGVSPTNDGTTPLGKTANRFSSAFLGSGTAITTSAPTIGVANTLNSSGVTFNIFDIAITDTASAAASTFATWRAGATTMFSVNSKTGLITTNSQIMLASNQAFTNGAAAQIATITNGPTAGNPTKWIPINDNGTTRYIPAW